VYVSLADNYSTGGNGTGWIYGYDGDTQVWSQSVAWIGNQPPSEDDWWRQALTQVTAGAGKPIDNIRLYNPGGTPDQWLRVDNMTVDVVPEPGTLLLLVTGLLGLLAYAWRKRK
ncbi:MAG: PEP-CTERM sorting domain-containing protein, partial [Planctomycetota bacterium]|nr:PEP-CTERM sorting domain-containing protein [Planctomycetota bacterium]